MPRLVDAQLDLRVGSLGGDEILDALRLGVQRRELLRSQEPETADHTHRAFLTWAPLPAAFERSARVI